MNGRVYDPVLARFLSPDPTIPNATDAQHYNRYSYVVDNPLRYTDPTGYGFWGDVAGFFENPANEFMILGAAVACLGSPEGCVAWGIMQLAMSTADAVSSGASFGQTVASLDIGVSFSFLSMGTVNAFGGGGLTGIVAGSISSMASRALTDVVGGRKPGYDVLESGFESAVVGAFSYGVQQAAVLTEAAAVRFRG